MKKVLALTVVLATLLSISAFAAFSDEESINENFVDAVNLLGALNVMTGDTEGTFRPNDTISRAEAAKMIYVIRNGGVDDRAEGWTGMSTFSDVTPGVWYEGYVNYCASIGIIAGIGNGLFNPSGAVTGVELAKMMLVVADYRPDIEKYTGAGWNLNVIRDAQTAGMFKGYTLAYSAAATRQQAAQLFANAILETEMAVYIGDVRVNNAAMLGTAETVGGRFFGLYTVTGILTKVPHVDLPYAPEYDKDGNFEGLQGTNDVSDLNANDDLAMISDLGVRGCENAVFEFEADPDLLYQEVDVIFREDTEDPGVLSRDSKVYAVLPTGNTYVYDTTMDAITIAPSNENKPADYSVATSDEDYNPMTIQFEGYNGNRAKVLDEKFTLPVITNLYEGKALKNEDVTAAVKQADWNRNVYVVSDLDTINMLATTSTAPVRLIDYNRDGVLDIAFVTTPYYGTVSSYNADRYEFTTDAAINEDNITSERDEDIFANFTFEDEVEKDDVIAVTIDVLSGEMKYNVALVEPTVGNVTRVYSTGADNEVVIGGETYGFYGLDFGGKKLTAAGVDLSAENYHDELGNEVTVYTDGKYILTAEVAPASLGTGFAFVKNYNTEGNSFDSMLTDSEALLFELVLPNGDTVVKEYRRDEVASSSNEGKFYVEQPLEAGGVGLNGIDLDSLLGNIVEYKASGDYVAFYNASKLDADDEDELEPNYFEDEGKYQYNNETGLFREVGSKRGGVDVNENSVFFLPTYKDDVEKADLSRGDITKVAVITGDELRGMPTVTTENNGPVWVMQMVSCLQNGIDTVAFAVLDENSTVSDTGTFAYTLSNDYHAKEDEDDEYRVQGVLSNSGSDEMAELLLDHDDVVANKVYRVTENSDGTMSLSQVSPGKEVEGEGTTMDLGSIRGARNNRVTINVKGASETYYFDPDTTVVYVVDTRNWGDITLGDFSDLSEAREVDPDADPVEYYNNVLFEYDTELYLTVVYVEAVGRDVEALISYEETASMDIELPTLTLGAELTDLDTDHFTIESKPETIEADTDELTLTITAKAGSIFADSIEKQDASGNWKVTLPKGYTVDSVKLDSQKKILTVAVSIDTAKINDDVTAEIIEEFVPEIDVNDVTPPTADKVDTNPTVTLSAEEGNFEENPLVEEVKLTYANEGVDEIVLEKVEVTLSDDYNDPSKEDLQAVVEALADKLGLDVANGLKPTIAGGAMVLAAAPRAARPVITKAEYDQENNVLTLTIVENPVSFEFTTATLADTSEEDPESVLYEEGSYKIDVVDNGNDHYTVKVSAKDLKEHQNGASPANRGYWVGVQIGSFSENVKGWRTAYKGYATTAAVDEALEAGPDEWIATSEDASPLAWYRDANKDSTNNKGRDWTVGIQLLGESEGEEENVLKTVYVTFDVDNVDFSEESAEDTPTEPEKGEDSGATGDAETDTQPGNDDSQGQEGAAEKPDVPLQP